nr:helix-turn-helix transcriptional regulator [Caulobacter soli]
MRPCLRLHGSRFLSVNILSPRQRQCLSLACRGLTSSQIAVELGLSRRTVDQYFLDAFRRLGARNRAQAVAEALRRGEIVQDVEPPDDRDSSFEPDRIDRPPALARHASGPCRAQDC